jgi:uncharacterized protein (DUF885 family)
LIAPRSTGTQRVSEDLMEWQLSEAVREEPFLDYEFPLEQMGGVNVGVVEAITLTHPVFTEGDVENYVAALGAVRKRMEGGRLHRLMRGKPVG